MDFKHWFSLLEDRQLYFNFMKVPGITWEQSKTMFGPVWHGTTEEAKQGINDTGFNIYYGDARTGNVRHGYSKDFEKGYGDTGIPTPVHHLGYGIYFTTKKSIVKQYNNNSLKNLTDYYLDIPNTETINFASPNTMMKWWIENGYNIQELIDKKDPDARVNATINMTNVLKSRYDAVYFKGSAMYGKTLDGNQICVYDTNNIYKIDLEAYQNKNEVLPGDKILLVTGDAVKVVSINKDVDGIYYTVKYTSKQQGEKISDKLKTMFFNQVRKSFEAEPDFEGIVSRRMQHYGLDREGAIAHRVNYDLSKEKLQAKMPKRYVARKLNKNEKIPRS